MKASQRPEVGDVVMLSNGISVYPGVPHKFLDLKSYLGEQKGFNEISLCNIKIHSRRKRIGTEMKFGYSKYQKNIIKEFLLRSIIIPILHLASPHTDTAKEAIIDETKNFIKKILPFMKKTLYFPSGEYVVLSCGIVEYDVGMIRPVYQKKHEIKLSKIKYDGTYDKDDTIIIHYKGCPPLKVVRKIEIKKEKTE